MIVFADLMGRDGMHGAMHLGATSGLADIISYNVVMSTEGYGSSALRAMPRPLLLCGNTSRGTDRSELPVGVRLDLGDGPRELLNKGLWEMIPVSDEPDSAPIEM